MVATSAGVGVGVSGRGVAVDGDPVRVAAGVADGIAVAVGVRSGVAVGGPFGGSPDLVVGCG